MNALQRRRFLGGMASLPALAGGAAILSTDPTYALIEKHKAAQHAFEAAVAADDGDGPDVERTSDAEREARYDMHEVAPTTLAGLAAYVAYWQEHVSRGRFELQEIGWEAIPTIAEACSKLLPIGGAA